MHRSKWQTVLCGFRWYSIRLKSGKKVIYFIYYSLSIISFFLYVSLKKKKLSDYRNNRKLNYIRVISIISFYCMGTFSLYLMSIGKNDDIKDWSVLISSLVLLLMYFYFISTLETPKR